MYDFSIESSAEKIYDARTKKYFSEVMQTYVNGNYRSATVMLWSVVVCDLIYKLQELKDVYNEEVAETILDEVAAMQAVNPNSPEWESQLVEKIKARTQLLNVADHGNLRTLQNHRHLSAHPVLGDADLLHEPNKETVRSDIRNVLEGLLWKPPLLTKNVFEQLVIDLSDKQELFPDDTSLKRYLDAKFFRNMTEGVLNYVFRNLWKFVFRLKNEDTNANRDINFRALEILYRGSEGQFRQLIAEHADSFSEISDGEPTEALIEFLSIRPNLFGLLTPVAQEPIKAVSESSLDMFSIAFFLSESTTNHLDTLLEKIVEAESVDHSDGISKDNWSIINGVCEEDGIVEKARRVGVELYVRSMNYDSADRFFRHFVAPYIGSHSIDELQRLFEGTEENGQTYGRGRATGDHRSLLEASETILGAGFDYTPYPHWENLL